MLGYTCRRGCSQSIKSVAAGVFRIARIFESTPARVYASKSVQSSNRPNI